MSFAIQALLDGDLIRAMRFRMTSYTALTTDDGAGIEILTVGRLSVGGVDSDQAGLVLAGTGIILDTDKFTFLVKKR